ncbi:SCO-spondin-like, partial [Pteropus vampyrus]|uniref:SCO-spondin-like n=1 Tax=Pteropus vampyrus TaxID=132908 RepID=A0A6P3RT74_PTEVA
CGPGLASRSGSCPCPLAEANRTCNGSFFHLDTQACYPGPCLEECVWSSWSSWTRCSCQVLVQQRYRHQRPVPGGAGEGALCTRLDGHFRPCLIGNCSDAPGTERGVGAPLHLCSSVSLDHLPGPRPPTAPSSTQSPGSPGPKPGEDSCTPPFEFQACGSPCASLCATHRSHQPCQDLPPCQPGCYCPEGLLEQTGGCVPAEQCSCQHISGGVRVTLAPGDHLRLGCKECECQHGELQCTSQGCQGLLPLSGWSEWSPCGPCLPASVLAPASRAAALEERWPQDPAGLSPTLAPWLASEQHRHRLCLDPETGRPWAGDPALCTGPLSQQRLCLDPGACG